jgi:apolipoprotein N-acyltransferase
MKLSSLLLRIVIGILLSLLSGLLLLLALPPTGIWPLAILGLAPALISQYRVLPRRMNSLATAIAIGGYIGLYILSLMPDLPGSEWIRLMPVALIVLIFFTDMGTRRLNERTGYRWFVLQGAIVWVGIEMIRNLIPFLGTGGFIAYAFSYSPALIQPISIFGIFGLSLVTMLLAYAIGLAAIGLFDRFVNTKAISYDAATLTVNLRNAARWVSITLAVALAWAASSLLMFRPSTTSTVRVAAVQPTAELTYTQWGSLVELTREAAQKGARIVVWPEGALLEDPQTTRTAQLRELAKETNTYLVIGYSVRSSQGNRNEATVLAPDGRFLGVYGKDHPIVWLGETSATRGTYPTYETPLATISTIICYDLIFVDTARKMAAGGAQLVAVPSNDWQSLADKEYTHLVFRAVENRVAMVKADTRYDSVVIDAYGRIVDQLITPDGGRGILIADVPLGTADAPQIVLGDWVGWLCLVGLVYFALPFRK